MKYKFYISYGSASTEVFPLGFTDKCTFNETKDDGRIFMRRFLSGNLIFTNREGITDFDTFYAIDQDSDLRCSEIYFDVYRSCDNGETYQLHWQGYFTTTDGEFNIDRCIFTVEAKPNDKYRCIVERANEDFKFNSLPDAIDVNTFILPNYEFFVCRNTVPCVANKPYPQSTWDTFHTETFEGNIVWIFYRERVVVACEAGSSVPPPSGSGWELTEDNCSENGTSVYTRLPVQSYFFAPNAMVAPGNCDSGNAAIPPAQRTINVDVTNTPAARTIKGYDTAQSSAIANTGSEYWFEIPDNPNSTYVWDYIAGGPSFVVTAGAGTNKVKGEFGTGGSSFGTCTIRCTETTSCGDVNVSTKDITVVNTTTTVDIDTMIESIAKACKSQIITISIWDLPLSTDPAVSVSNPVWSVNNGASIISGQGTTEIIVNVGTVSATFGQAAFFTVSVEFEVLNPAEYGTVTYEGSKQILVGNAIRTDEIAGITSVCPNDSGLEYSVRTRSGATYAWTVTNGTIVSGQGTGSIIVDWGAVDGTVTVRETLNCGCTWLKIADCDGIYPSYWWCLDADYTSTNSRKLQGIINYLKDRLCGTNNVISDFFEWNPPGDTAGYVAGENYVTGEINHYSNISMNTLPQAIHDAYDYNGDTPTAEQLDTWTKKIAKHVVNWNLIEQLLREVFNCYWFIDDTNTIRIEHFSWFQRSVAYDLTSAQYSQRMIGRNIYKYDKINAPKYERFRWLDAVNFDFVGAEISYIGSCLNNDAKTNSSERGGLDVMTDIYYIITAPSDIANQGFLLLANDDSNGTWQNIGKLSQANLTNVDLSWANLHYNFHRHNRTLIQGFMNLTFQSFLSALRFKKQENCVLPLCCDDDIDSLNDLIETEIGQGVIEELEINLKTNIATISLAHDL